MLDLRFGMVTRWSSESFLKQEDLSLSGTLRWRNGSSMGYFCRCQIGKEDGRNITSIWFRLFSPSVKNRKENSMVFVILLKLSKHWPNGSISLGVHE